MNSHKNIIATLICGLLPLLAPDLSIAGNKNIFFAWDLLFKGSETRFVKKYSGTPGIIAVYMPKRPIGLGEREYVNTSIWFHGTTAKWDLLGNGEYAYAVVPPGEYVIGVLLKQVFKVSDIPKDLTVVTTVKERTASIVRFEIEVDTTSKKGMNSYSMRVTLKKTEPSPSRFQTDDPFDLINLLKYGSWDTRYALQELAAMEHEKVPTALLSKSIEYLRDFSKTANRQQVIFANRIADEMESCLP